MMRKRSRNHLANIRRIGAPSSSLADMYYFLVSSSWTRLTLLFCVIYLISNAAFAGLYLLVPDSIAGAEPGSFSDAYFFSVQSMSTIGYGGMAPQSTWAHVWVTIQAMFGLILVALVTGIVFAKFARPTANVLFSKVAIVTRRNGRPALVFRVANAREGALVSASMQLTVLRTEITDEGDTLRRLIDLKLLRADAPFFTLSWTVIHEIDANSPLYGLDEDDWAEDDVALIALLTGHDGDYGSTVYAQHLYYGEDLRWGHRFVDVVDASERQLTLNYRLFHQTEPLATPDPLEPPASAQGAG